MLETARDGWQSVFRRLRGAFGEVIEFWISLKEDGGPTGELAVLVEGDDCPY